MNKKILHRVFEHIASQFPDRIAVDEETRSITYGALNSGANSMARALQAKGVGTDVVVGLFIPAGVQYIMSVLAVLKAGGIFMPLDAEAPPKRLAYMLQKTSPRFILTLADTITALSNIVDSVDTGSDPHKQITILSTDDINQKGRLKDEGNENLDETPDPQSANYIIFTSGSTGNPKAILGRHVSLSHFIHWELGAYELDETAKFSLFAPTTFDVSFRDIFVPLLCGGTLCIPGMDTVRNTPNLVDWMVRSRLTHIHCVPTLFRLIRKELQTRAEQSPYGSQPVGDAENQVREKAGLPNETLLPDLKNILLAGEALYGTDVLEWMDLFGHRIALSNLYGPSETTLAKIHYKITERPSQANQIIPLGAPISNTAVLILKENRLCKVGEIGEIFIKTPFSSLGYYKNPELNAQNFIQNPLTDEADTIYKTGDLGRYMVDRQVEFVGRLDSQVKINGNRIELGEIESRLFAHDAIDRPLVTAHTTPDHENRLVCYYTLKEGENSQENDTNAPSCVSAGKDTDPMTREAASKALDPADLRDYLSDFLPAYMLPSFFVHLNSFPLNLNGKVDRRKLPKPEDLVYDRVPYETPSNEEENKLAEIFATVLGLSKVGVNTPFFDLGGNSLNAIRIISRIFSTFQIEIAIRDFFENPTIRGLARFLEKEKTKIGGKESAGDDDDNHESDAAKTDPKINSGHGKASAPTNHESPGPFKGKDIQIATQTIAPSPKAEHYPLSHAQRRLWIFEQLDPNFIAYNIPGAYLIKGTLKIPVLKAAFQALIQRHESLRTVFRVVEGAPRQFILDEVDFELPLETLAPSSGIAIRNASDKVQRNTPSTRSHNLDIDLAKTGPDDMELAPIRAVLAKDAATGFDMENGPMMRIRLFKVSQGHVLGLNIHHIITDALSQENLIRELLIHYEAFSRCDAASLSKGPTAVPQPLSPLPFHYKDYVAWQERMEEQPKMQAAKTYWEQRLYGELPLLNLPTDLPRPMLQSPHGARQTFTIAPDLYRELTEFGKSRHSSLFMVLTTILKLLLYRYTGQKDIILGTPVASRNHPDLENQIGLYINMLALRDIIAPDQSTDTLLKGIRQTCIEAFDHQIYPFDRLVGDLSLERDLSRNVGFDVMIVLHHQEPDLPSVSGLTASPLEFENPTAKYDLTFTIFAGSDSLSMEIEYNTDLFLPDRIIRMGAHFETLAAAILTNPTCPVGQLEIMPVEEKRQVISKFNATERDYPKDLTMADLFERQAAKRPNATAIAYEDVRISYAELDRLGNRLGQYLIETHGVQPEDKVTILMEKSPWVPVAMLGIHKAGAAYLPINLATPPERIRYIVEDSECNVLLTDENAINNQLIDFRTGEDNSFTLPCPVTDLPQLFSEEMSTPIYPPKVERRSNQVGFVIYTSGSTGLPKGTLLEHRHMIRLVYNPIDGMINPGECMSQTTAFSFDVHVFEIWGGLINGCCLCIPPETAIVEAPQMHRYIQGHGLDIMWMTTSLFNQFVEVDIEMFKGVKKLIVGGEKLSAPHLNRVKDAFPEIRLFNGYGPTENSVFTTLFELEKRYPDDVPIGPPSANCKVTVLDENDHPVPIGIPGELCAWGDGVARGYLNRPELNEKCFVSHPLFPQERMYRIGDMGMWDADGILHYFGRNDDQVKVRGYRIELGEITNAILSHPDIPQAIVMIRTLEDGFNKELVAYFTATLEAQKELTPSAMRTFLSDRLPGYMVPAHFVALEKMPLNPSGKVDRSNLPAPERIAAASDSDIDYNAPRTSEETILVKVWQKILNVPKIGIFDNYFTLGGDSIKAIQMVSHLSRENLVAEVRDIFQNPTIADLARYVQPAKITIDQDAVIGKVPLTAVQHWFFNHHETTPHHFNQAQLIHSKVPMVPDAVEKAIIAVQAHHDALRMTFSLSALSESGKNDFQSESADHTLHTDTGPGNIIQKNRAIDHPLDFEFIDFSRESNPVEALNRLTEEIQSGIDLENGPLFKSRLIRMSDGDRLLMVLHHLIVDGISWRILAEDIQTAYQQLLEGETILLPPKTHSFKTWAEKIQSYAAETSLLDELDYWQEIENAPVASFPLNSSFNNPESDSGNGGAFDAETNSHMLCACGGRIKRKDTETVEAYLGPDETELLLTTAHQALRTQVNDLLLTALAQAFSSWHGGAATRIVLEGHGREEIIQGVDISRTVGWFTTMYPVLLDLPKGHDISYQVKHIKETLRNVPNNGFGYGILRYLSPSDTPFPSKRLETENGANHASPKSRSNRPIEWGPLPSVSFNYLGRFDTETTPGFAIAQESAGNCIGPDVEITQDIDINSMVTDRGLHITLTYNTKALSSHEMRNLIQAFKSALELLITYLVDEAESDITPSDIDFDGMDMDELDQMLNSIGDN